ncbi:MAG: DNA polymerase III subunit gamma/tau [Rectinemataceae bacterium]|jgi:DNA polymerase-3 subunit gamma/tau
MPYEITATRKRPQSFAELAGQEFVSATLEASLANGRIAHAYLFSGPRGCGKTSTARILARALNCEKGPSARPCGKCRSCVEIARGASLDVIEIDGASNTSVDNVRQIKDEVLFPPNGGRYKVYIIDEVHMLSNSAFNALLKTIEEPPPYIVFIFATTELHKVPATIKSRCQQFAFRLLRIDTVKSLLAVAAAETGVEAEDDALLWIAKESGGSPRDAYTLFDQVVSFSEGKITYALIRDKLGLTGLDALGSLFGASAAGDTGAALIALDEILARGVSPEQIASEAAEYCRSLLLIRNGITKAALLGAPTSSYNAAALEIFTSEHLERALAELLDLYRDLRYTVDPRFELELVVAKLCRLADYVSESELAKVVSSLKRRLAGEGTIDGIAADTMIPRKAIPDVSPPEEKKKPELPPQLSAAFDSLAATASRPRIMSDASEADAEAEGETIAGPISGESPPVGGPDPLRAAVIDALGRSSPLLKTGLASSLPWRVEERRIVIPFRSGMDESVVRSSLADIAAKASELAGRQLKVELKVESTPRPADVAASKNPVEAGPDPVAIVERVFRGTRMPDSGRGAHDELR